MDFKNRGFRRGCADGQCGLEREGIGCVEMVPEIAMERGLRGEEDTRVLEERRRRHCFLLSIPSVAEFLQLSC